MKSVFVMFLVTALILGSCSQNKSGPRGGSQPNKYKVLTLRFQTMTIHQDFPATIEGQRVIEIRPMISGYLKDIYVNEGEQVRKGQLLFGISNPQYEQDVITAKARINSARADVNSARIDIEKIRPLVEKDIVSSYRLKSAELILQAREASLEQAKAELSNAETNLSYTIIRSPEDGLIGTIPYKNGALVGSASAEALTTLSDIRNVYAYFSWNEKKLLDMLENTNGFTIDEKVNSIPEATLILANSTEYPEKGKVEMASGLISTATGSATFKAIFPNPTGLIRSGSSATVRLPEVIDSVFVIPQGATYELQNKRFVYVADAENKVAATPFQSVPSDDGQYFLVTEGLQEGDKVVVEGVSSLKDGVTIIPEETGAMTQNSQVKQ